MAAGVNLCEMEFRTPEAAVANNERDGAARPARFLFAHIA